MTNGTVTGGKIPTLSPLDKALRDAQNQAEQARLSNLARQQQIEAIWNEVISRYQPGGTFQAEAMRQLDVQKGRDVTREYGGGVQEMMSRGLFGTSAGMTEGEVGRKWERDVGAPTRLKLEDLMMSRLSQAEMGKASFLEGIEHQYPDPNAIAQLAAQAGNRPNIIREYDYGRPKQQSVPDAPRPPSTPFTYSPDKSAWQSRVNYQPPDIQFGEGMGPAFGAESMKAPTPTTTPTAGKVQQPKASPSWIYTGVPQWYKEQLAAWNAQEGIVQDPDKVYYTSGYLASQVNNPRGGPRGGGK